MNVDAFVFVVPGRPEPRREPLVGRRGHYQHPRNTDYYERVAWAWRQAGAVRLPKAPLVLEVVAVFDRPKSHVGVRGLTAIGRAMHFPTMRPDLSNVIKGVEDALVRAGAIPDDSFVISPGGSAKAWATPTRACGLYVMAAVLTDPTERS